MSDGRYVTERTLEISGQGQPRDSTLTHSFTFTMGQSASAPSTVAPSAPAKCPIDHSKSSASPSSASSQAPAKCPIDHNNLPSSASSSSSSRPAQCPIQHDTQSQINPLNQMPSLSQQPAPNQESLLPVDRETSSIPRDDESRWEYPSPQQFYNALVRKGWETPEEHVETMVQIHNFLNEQAWNEIVKWEKKVDPCVFPLSFYHRSRITGLLISHCIQNGRPSAYRRNLRHPD